MTGKKTVAVDVDDVLADYSAGWQGLEKIGDPLPGAVEFTRELSKFARVLIYTTRCCEDREGRDVRKAAELEQLLRAWLDQHGFSYDAVWTGQGKPFYAALIDDRAVACRPRDHGAMAFRLALLQASQLCGVPRESGPAGEAFSQKKEGE